MTCEYCNVNKFGFGKPLVEDILTSFCVCIIRDDNNRYWIFTNGGEMTNDQEIDFCPKCGRRLG